MLYSGLVSATFRAMLPHEIIPLAVKAGLAGIEWSSREHVLPGDTARAEAVRKQMDESGLITPSYGTYYYAGADGNPDFSALIENALILGAPIIRVWAGKNESSDSITESRRAEITEDLRRICAAAARYDIQVSTEYHNYTLTDTFESAMRLLRDIPSLRTHWQADENKTASEHLRALNGLLDRLAVVHAAWWRNHEQKPFEEAEADWKEYIRILKTSGRDHYILLEFVRNGDPEQMLHDAASLKRFIVCNTLHTDHRAK